MICLLPGAAPAGVVAAGGAEPEISSTVIWLIIIGVVVLIVLLRMLWNVFWRKANQSVFNRGDYARQRALTGQVWSYSTKMDPASVRAGLSAHLLGPQAEYPGLVTLEENDSVVRYGFTKKFRLNLGGVAGSISEISAGKYEFEAVLTLPAPGNDSVSFTFARWIEDDGVAREVEAMELLVDRVDAAIRATDPSARLVLREK